MGLVLPELAARQELLVTEGEVAQVAHQQSVVAHSLETAARAEMQQLALRAPAALVDLHRPLAQDRQRREAQAAQEEPRQPGLVAQVVLEEPLSSLGRHREMRLVETVAQEDLALQAAPVVLAAMRFSTARAEEQQQADAAATEQLVEQLVLVELQLRLAGGQ